MTGTLSGPAGTPAAPSSPPLRQTAGQPGQLVLSARRPRPVNARSADDWLALTGSLAGALGLVWISYDRLLPFSGLVGFCVCWYVIFLACYATVSAMAHPRPIVIDRLVAAMVHGGAGIVLGAVAWTVIYTFYRGSHAISHVNFFTQSMNSTTPTAPLSQGGILHAIVGSLIEVGIAIAVSLPLGVGTAVFMTEVGGWFARGVRTIVEAMTALPDILAGLFILTTLIVGLGVQKTGFAAAMALSVMGLPIIARSSEVVLRVVPGGLREASLALGASRWRTVWRVVLPTARPGLATALILGIARVIGETAPVLLTSGAAQFFNANPFSEPMNSLPLFIYVGFLSGEKAFADRIWGAAAVLLALVLVLFITARVLARSRPGRS
jgi:phosphate transport system permease protein